MVRPCKYMRNVIFPQAEMGNYFNDKFVNIEVTTGHYGQRQWTGEKLVCRCPCYHDQIFDQCLPYLPHLCPPTDVFWHRIVGGGTVKSFINEVQGAFDTTKQYYTKLQQFENGKTRQRLFLRQFAIQANDAYDLSLGMKVAKAYLAGQPNLLTPQQLIWYICTPPAQLTNILAIWRIISLK